MTLQTDTAIIRDGDGLRANLLPEWGIWGPNGGYLSAIALRAGATVAPAGHRPVSLSVQYRRGEAEHPFWHHFETRPVGFTGPPNPEPLGHVLRQWTRYLDWEATDDPFLDACRAVVLIDALVWPAHWRGCAVDPDYVAPSLDLTVWFHAAATDADWLLADAHADTAGGGLIHGGVRIWTGDGRLIASGGSQLLVFPNRPA